ncbi:MAG TPA: helix-turn-helix domain-containing protein [Candidatus Binatia bacterium]
MSDRLLTVREAAEMLGLKPSTMYALAYERRIATVKIGRALRFKTSELEKLVKRSERPALRSFSERDNGE